VEHLDALVQRRKLEVIDLICAQVTDGTTRELDAAICPACCQQCHGTTYTRLPKNLQFPFLEQEDRIPLFAYSFGLLFPQFKDDPPEWTVLAERGWHCHLAADDADPVVLVACISYVGVSAVVVPADEGPDAGFERPAEVAPAGEGHFIDETSIGPGEHGGWVLR
jgi:hypothetical protein